MSSLLGMWQVTYGISEILFGPLYNENMVKHYTYFSFTLKVISTIYAVGWNLEYFANFLR